jgi:excisionase family DNA binding protein
MDYTTNSGLKLSDFTDKIPSDEMYVTLKASTLEELIKTVIEMTIDKKGILIDRKPENALSVIEAAKYIDKKVNTIYSKVHRGELHGVRVKNKLYFMREELDKITCDRIEDEL